MGHLAASRHPCESECCLIPPPASFCVCCLHETKLAVISLLFLPEDRPVCLVFCIKEPEKWSMGPEHQGNWKHAHG